MQKHYDTVLGSDGSPLNGASVSVFTAGTTTPATIYSDNGSTLAANPLTTNANGAYSFYANDGLYDIQISKSGYGTITLTDVQLDEQDTAGTIAFTPTGGIAANTVAGALTELDGELSALTIVVASKSDSSHNHSGTYDVYGAASSAISTHEAAVNPHPTYLTQTEGDALYAAKVDAPVFRAYASSTTSIANGGTGTQVALQTEVVDTNGCFASSKFTPTVAGWYQIQAKVSFADAVMTSSAIGAGIAKNGTTLTECVAYSVVEANGGYMSAFVADVIYLNGSTDYVSLVATQYTGSPRNIDAAYAATYMSGFLVKAG